MRNHSSSVPGFHKKLHLHLFELPHPEDELAGDDLIPEGFANLGDPEGDFHPAGFLDVEVVDENSLGGFRAQVNLHRPVGGRTHFGGKHQVELAHFRPIAGARNGTDDLLVNDDLAEFLQVAVVEGFGKAAVQLIPFLLVFQNPRVGGPELRLIEGIAKPFTGFVDLFRDFIFDFGQLLLNKHVGPVSFFGILVVDEGVVERVDMARGLPDSGVHEDGRIDPYHILVQKDHTVPPIFLDVVLQLDAVLSVVVYR